MPAAGFAGPLAAELVGERIPKPTILLAESAHLCLERSPCSPTPHRRDHGQLRPSSQWRLPAPRSSSTVALNNPTVEATRSMGAAETVEALDRLAPGGGVGPGLDPAESGERAGQREKGGEGSVQVRRGMLRSRVALNTPPARAVPTGMYIGTGVVVCPHGSDAAPLRGVIGEAIRYAESNGWRYRASGRSAYAWGFVVCVQVSGHRAGVHAAWMPRRAVGEEIAEAGNGDLQALMAEGHARVIIAQRACKRSPAGTTSSSSWVATGW